MKDPRSGPIAVVTLVLVLLLKFAALLALIEQQHSVALIIVPLIGRGAMLGLFLTTPYVRAGGLGQALADHLPRLAGKQVLAVSALACVLIAGLSGVLARGAGSVGVCLVAAGDAAAIGRDDGRYGGGVAGIAGGCGAGGVLL